MNSIRVLKVFGTRLEAIKMVPVHKALGAAGEFDVRVCATVQHRHMLDQVKKLFATESKVQQVAAGPTGRIRGFDDSLPSC